jgi:hypothetical protein
LFAAGLFKLNFLKIIFYLYFAKINGPPEILQNYTFAAAAQTVEVLPPCGTAAGAMAHWQGHVPSWVTTLGSYCHAAQAVGAYRQAEAWPPGSAAGHGGMHGPIAVPCGSRIFFGKFQYLKH